MNWFRIAAGALLLPLAWMGSGRAEDLFLDRVSHLLEDHCFRCHNSVDRKGEFSLQTKDELAASGYVEPGDPEGSVLIEALESQDGRPPSMPQTGRPLSANEVRDLKRWVREGARWPDGHTLGEPRPIDRNWWSLVELKRPPPPVTPPATPSKGANEAANWPANWARNPVDAFIAARLAEQRLAPSPEAGRATLIRRLYFDLIGLPPTVEQVAAFVANPDPLAYEKLVDQLLASPRYGERWARHWMDVVHYADTHGYDKDKLRPNAWPYRDYLIRAWNRDKPYRRFVQEQLAGDVLFQDADGMEATGFVAAGPWDFIGHAEVPETKLDGRVARHLDRDDMVTSTMNTFCSVTIQCARCHHHKLDPVTMTDYYRLQAVFAGVDRADRKYDADPEVAGARRTLQEELTEVERQAAALESELESQKPPELRALEKRLQALAASADGSSHPPRYGYHSAVASRPDAAKWVQVDLGASRAVDRVLLFGAVEYGWADFGFPESLRVELSESADFARPQPLGAHRAAADARPGAAPVAFSGQGLSGRYVRVTAERLWSRRHKGQPESKDWIFALGELAVVSQGQLVPPTAVTSLDSIEAAPRWSRENLTDQIFGVESLPAELAAPLKPEPDAESDAGPDAAAAKLEALRKRQAEWLLARWSTDKLAEWTRQRDAMLAAAVKPEQLVRRESLAREVARLRQALEALPPQQTVYSGVVHFGSGAFRGRGGLGPREIFILHRGDVAKPGEPAQPGTIPLSAGDDGLFHLSNRDDEGQRRAALAHWITRSDHPLTWRSIANRIWQYHFGRGLAGSPNDFGRGGERPTHPELLDYLACEIRDHQSIKRLHRLICLSAAYRQSSSPPVVAEGAEDPLQVDRDNRLWWRMNRRRLTAEDIRDAVLMASGSLDLRMGGMGFQDFVLEQPAHSPHYEYSKYDPLDAATHRRAVYRFIVRSQPQPFMTTLDCADPSMSVPQRDETLTALQALTMLNNPFMVAMSQRLAATAEREAPSAEGQLRRAFERVMGRPPAPQELAPLESYRRRQGLPAACRVLLNLNEFVFVD